MIMGVLVCVDVCWCLLCVVALLCYDGDDIMKISLFKTLNREW